MSNIDNLKVELELPAQTELFAPWVNQGGLGLGLSVVLQLVELHGGTVWAESPGEGKGTSFKVILPLMSAHHGLSDGELTRPMIGQRSE